MEPPIESKWSRCGLFNKKEKETFVGVESGLRLVHLLSLLIQVETKVKRHF